MKKFLAIVMVLMLVLSLTACGSSGTSEKETAEEASETAATETESDDIKGNSEWKEFIKEYEAFVDKYIETIKKYKANPSDMTVLTEYSEMATQIIDWTKRAEKLTEKMDASEALECSAALAKIAEKIQKATEE